MAAGSPIFWLRKKTDESWMVLVEYHILISVLLFIDDQKKPAISGSAIIHTRASCFLTTNQCSYCQMVMLRFNIQLTIPEFKSPNFCWLQYSRLSQIKVCTLKHYIRAATISGSKQNYFTNYFDDPFSFFQQ